jgi:thiol-disulfide isomerase/thioredoxin
VLAAGVSGVAALLTGCSTRSNGRSAPAEPTPTGSAADPTATDPPATATARAETSTGDGLLLPSLDVEGSPGGLVALEPQGKATLLDFFATWCPPCEPEMAVLRSVREQYGDGEAAIVSVTQERDEAAVESFWETHRGSWPVVLDPSTRAARRYGVTTIPTIVVLAPDGTEVARHTGFVAEARLLEALETALERDETD